MKDTPVITITVPYMPTLGTDGVMIAAKPSDFPKTKRYHKKTYQLKEIQGSNLVWFDDSKSWEELGFNAIYQWNGKL